MAQSDTTPVCRTRKACKACRAVKVKCLPPSALDGATDTCTRCIRYHLTCDYSRKPRTRVGASADRAPLTPDKPAVGVKSGAGGFEGLVDEVLEPVGASDRVPVWFPFKASSSAPSDQAQTGHEASSQAQSLGKWEPMQSFVPETSIHQASQLSWHRQNAQSTSLAHRLEPYMGVDDSRPPSRQSTAELAKDSCQEAGGSGFSPVDLPPEGDPLSMIGLSEIEARYLVNTYHEEVNLAIGLLDPAYHSYSMVRQTSAALFTAILYAGSRAKKSSLAPLLRSHAKILCNRSFDRGSVGLGTIQALCLLVFLRDPKDSAWLHLGLAVRAAYQVGLHKSVGSKTQDVSQRTAQLNRERTWIVLQGLEYTSCRIYELPCMIRPEHMVDVAQWLDDHLDLAISADHHLACFNSLGPVMEVVSPQSVYGTLSTAGGSNNQLDLAEAHLLEQEHVWLQTARSRHIPEASRTAFRITTGFFRFFIQAHRLGLAPGRGSRINMIVAAQTAMDRLEELEPERMQFFWADTISIMISQYATCLYKIRSSLDHSQLNMVATLLDRARQACERALVLMRDHPLTHVTRFINRLQRALGSLQGTSSHKSGPNLAMYMCDNGQSMEPQTEMAEPNVHDASNSEFEAWSAEALWAELMNSLGQGNFGSSTQLS